MINIQTRENEFKDILERKRIHPVYQPIISLDEPGNTEILRKMNRQLLEDKKFSVIYADLDFFKWYNDKHGFQNGDQMIQYTADILQHSITVCGTPYDFVGHVGWDDFIVITLTDDPEKLCQEIIRRFDSGISHFYEEEYRFVEDRHGNTIEAKGVTISLSFIIFGADDSELYRRRGMRLPSLFGI